MLRDVKAWQETVTIPTYGIGEPDKNPMFLEKRVYQGSSGSVYPHPVVEKIFDEKTERSYLAFFLENAYLKIMILPELGGRVQMAFDKVRHRHFVYYNEVIKPALVGLTGPWISGGIEFNWPQHHRPSTFLPVDATIVENADGSKTVWVNELEIMFHTKGMAGFTLYPDRAYLEISGRLYNRTAFPQTFLWWANPAVKVNNHYQSVFPPDVHAVFDHGRRDVSDFPIATGTYYKVNYAPGTDISRYKNIPVPTSFMAVNSRFNFMGGYENDTKGGLLHVANHHISPGKKQWTWGNGEFGQAWDRNLTDNDGPYIELMTGMFTDNQPDFSWINPNEEKSFEQYFMPYAELGVVKNASRDAAINVELKDGKLCVMVYTTGDFKQARIRITAGEMKQVMLRDLHAAGVFVEELGVGPVGLDQVAVDVLAENGRVLVDFRPEPNAKKEIPSAAAAARQPSEILSIEELFLNGLHLEQYRHATFQATDYYLEALRREPGDVRCNNAMGLWLMRRGQLAQARDHFERAVKTLTARNPNPYDGEPYFNLGTCLTLLGLQDEAYAAYYKATWNDAFQHSGFLALARIDAGRQEFCEALRLVERSLLRNGHSHIGRHLKVVLLRKLGRTAGAEACIQESLDIDPFNFGCLFEQYLLSADADNGKALHDRMVVIMRREANNYMEVAFDYTAAGFFREAVVLLEVYTAIAKEQHPMAKYLMAWCLDRLGETGAARKCREEAAMLSPDRCFPNRVEELAVLQEAIRQNPSDYKALYYVGNFWYGARQYAEAIDAWQRSVAVQPSFPTTHRNLSLAYYNKLNDPARALASLEKAFGLDDTDARVLMELDQLYKKVNRPVDFRLKILDRHLGLVEQRDDLFLEWVALHNAMGKFSRAKELIGSRQFHPWEGGEGKVVGQYITCHVELAKQCLADGEYQRSLDLLNAAGNYPDNLGEGKLFGAQENDIHFLQGLALKGLGMLTQSHDRFTDAAQGISEPVQAIFYNDPQPDKIFYQGLAWRELGKEAKATGIFRRLTDFADRHMNDHIKIDYFAVSLPDLLVFEADLDLKNRIHCHYMKGLGLLGLGNMQAADAEFEAALSLDVNHSGARVHRQMIQWLAAFNTR